MALGPRSSRALPGRKLALTTLKSGAGLAITSLVIAARLALNPWLGQQSNRHLVFLPTVMLVAWFGGFAAGFLSSALFAVALLAFYAQAVRASYDVVLFFLIAIAISALMESLRRARARADAAAKDREQVLAVVAHDLRNPLTAITMASAALAHDAPGGAKQWRRLLAIDRSARRMEKLISDLVEATKIEQHGLQIATKEELVETIVNEIAESFAPLAREKRLALETSASLGGLTVSCDRERVLQVLANLVANALRFTPEGGCISLRTEVREDTVRFEVKDTGPGIRPEDLPHIFDRYWNSDRKGTGLGLYIAENLVRAHGGQIGVDSRPGVGATFHFTLPRRIQPRAQEGPLWPWLRRPRATG
jgi:signal transduction histidine kinase